VDDSSKIAFWVSKELHKLAKVVAVCKGVTLESYVDSVVRPVVCVDHAELWPGEDFDVPTIVTAACQVRGCSEDEYTALAVRRQALLDYVQIVAALEERQRVAAN
jgi:hypothetical protein